MNNVVFASAKDYKEVNLINGRPPTVCPRCAKEWHIDFRDFPRGNLDMMMSYCLPLQSSKCGHSLCYRCAMSILTEMTANSNRSIDYFSHVHCPVLINFGRDVCPGKHGYNVRDPKFNESLMALLRYMEEEKNDKDDEDCDEDDEDCDEDDEDCGIVYDDSKGYCIAKDGKLEVGNKKRPRYWDMTQSHD